MVTWTRVTAGEVEGGIRIGCGALDIRFSELGGGLDTDAKRRWYTGGAVPISGLWYWVFKCWCQSSIKGPRQALLLGREDDTFGSEYAGIRDTLEASQKGGWTSTWISHSQQTPIPPHQGHRSEAQCPAVGIP